MKVKSQLSRDVVESKRKLSHAVCLREMNLMHGECLDGWTVSPECLPIKHQDPVTLRGVRNIDQILLKEKLMESDLN